MKIAICVMGSRGDVQPLVALGKGLQAAGHAVTLATHQEFQPMVRGAGLWFYLLKGGDPKSSTEAFGGEGPGKGRGRNHAVESIRMMRLLQAAIPEIGESCREACSGADCCISNFIPPAVASSVAEKMGIPHLHAILQPIEPTGEFPHLLATPRTFGRMLNLWSYPCVFFGQWGTVRWHVNRWRRQSLGLPPLPWHYFPKVFGGSMPRLYGFSGSVVPKPGEWNEKAAVTGYWFLDQTVGWSPPKALMDFLETGPAPIAIGLGSMMGGAADTVSEICFGALSRANQRGILITGRGGMHAGAHPDHVFVMESAPHEWLFSHMAAVVHHGDAGTTAASLRTGVPAIVVPFIAEQTFWGNRVYELGVGPKPIPSSRLTTERLAAAMAQAVSNPGIRQRAAELGAKIRAEDGVANAIHVIEHMMKER